jgi:hypothetical protein
MRFPIFFILLYNFLIEYFSQFHLWLHLAWTSSTVFQNLYCTWVLLYITSLAVYKFIIYAAKILPPFTKILQCFELTKNISFLTLIEHMPISFKGTSLSISHFSVTVYGWKEHTIADLLDKKPQCINWKNILYTQVLRHSEFGKKCFHHAAIWRNISMKNILWTVIKLSLWGLKDGISLMVSQAEK